MTERTASKLNRTPARFALGAALALSVFGGSAMASEAEATVSSAPQPVLTTKDATQTIKWDVSDLRIRITGVF